MNAASSVSSVIQPATHPTNHGPSPTASIPSSSIFFDHSDLVSSADEHGQRYFPTYLERDHNVTTSDRAQPSGQRRIRRIFAKNTIRSIEQSDINTLQLVKEELKWSLHYEACYRKERNTTRSKLAVAEAELDKWTRVTKCVRCKTG